MAGYVRFSLMESAALKNWTPEDTKPVFGPPAWTRPGVTYKDVLIVEYEGVYLLYYITSDKNGYCCVALNSTSGWVKFQDHGCVFSVSTRVAGYHGN
jgi:hypothetical protein